jgi:DNA-binding NarL/FixJ family response regulator
MEHHGALVSRLIDRRVAPRWEASAGRLKLAAAAAESGLSELTAREREVLALAAQGLTDRGIGDRLWLAPKTIETHMRHILAKLSLAADSNHNRRVLAVIAYLQEQPQRAEQRTADALMTHVV